MKIEPLPVNRWHELARALEESQCEGELPKPEHSIMLAMLDEDRIIGCVGAEKVWHASPLWVDKDHRGNGVPQQLVEEILKHNPEGLRQYCSTTNPHVELIIHRMGFVPVVGEVWRYG